MRIFILTLLCCATWASELYAATVHGGYAMTLYGTPKYAKNFKHTDYVNPNAPKGGRIKLSEMGGFDSLNPYILKGVKAPGARMLHESLMVQSQDEPMTAYLWVADSVSIAKDEASVSFTINPKARWHDGAPLTADDVVFSLNMLKEQGDPVYALYYKPITKAEASGRRVTFYFEDGSNPELPFAAASMPILPKHFFEGKPFDKPGLEPVLGSGPYRVGKVESGRAISYERVTDWWAADLPIHKGQYNFDVMQYDMYRDGNVSLEAFKAGEYDFRREFIARNWAVGYASPALDEGRFIKRELFHEIPQGMQTFLYNVRRPTFEDRRLREAISLAMDFDWLNETLFYGAYAQNISYFGNSDFAARGLPDAAERALLEPLADDLPPGILTQPLLGQDSKHAPKQTQRSKLLRAQDLLNAAGYVVRDGKRMDKHTGQPLRIEFLLRQPTMERVIGQLRKNLERLGVESVIRMVDDATYQQRLRAFDFDIISAWLNNGVFFPGNEQMLYWHSSQAMVEGANNLTGLSHVAVDALLAEIQSAQTLEKLVPAARALDRVLRHEHLAIPHWHSQSFRIAYWDRFAMPETNPSYDIGLMTWWAKPTPNEQGE